MDTKRRRRPHPRNAVTPVMVIPRQTHDEIERRQRIREAMHDAKAVTVRASRKKQQS